MKQTVGEYRVGVHEFNPTGSDEAVARLKQMAAAFIDECYAQRAAHNREEEVAILFDRAMIEAESAAMWAVKAATKPAWR